jgi:hypothetical protein
VNLGLVNRDRVQYIAPLPFSLIAPSAGGVAFVTGLRIIVVGMTDIAVAVQICSYSMHFGVRESGS